LFRFLCTSPLLVWLLAVCLLARRSRHSLQQRLIMQQNSPKPLSPESLKQTFDMNSEMIHQQVLSSMRISHSSFMAAMNKHKGDTAVRTLIGQTFRITQLMFVA